MAPRKTKKSTSSSSDGEMMVDDTIQRIIGYAQESEEKIERVLERFEASQDSSASASSKVSKASRSDQRAMKYQLKIAEEFRKYVEQSAMRIIMVLKEVTSLRTLMVKSYVQQIGALQTEDPRAFVASVANMDMAPEEYMQWTENDRMGFYILSHFFMYGTYVQPLTRAGADKAYWNHMCKEILNSMLSTPLVQSFFEFINKHKDAMETVGLDLADMIDTMRIKFQSELFALYNVLIAVPVKLNIQNQAFVYPFDGAYILCRDYLMKSHQQEYVKSVSQYMGGLENQIVMQTGMVGGGKKSVSGFSFKRFSKVGPKKKFF